MSVSDTKYRVLIICINPYIRIEFQDYLTSVLGSYIDFTTSSPSEAINRMPLENYHCILFSSQEVMNGFPLPVPEQTAKLVCTRTFNHAFLDQIIRIPPGEKVYVVNDAVYSAQSIIDEFKECGITQYQFIPCAPESMEIDRAIHYAITIGEPQLVPKHVRNIINIGNRIIDISTINELCVLFHLPAELSNQITKNYISHILKVVKTAGNHYQSYVYTQQLLQAAISNLPLSICLLNEEGTIILANKRFAADWSMPGNQAVGTLFTSYLPETMPELSFRHTADYRICNQRGEPLMLSVMELSFPNYNPVYLLTSKPLPPSALTEEPDMEAAVPPIEHQQNTFMNIITASDAWNEVLSYAKRLSLYDFPVLIQGESGTQKKMLANAIHKSSRRRNSPFVSLSQMLSLSESSLPKILEAANHGTLLVDNIESLSLPLQDFLVQVLQNANDTSGISYQTCNIRVIATTSANLYEKMEHGEFRQDLFFLLSGACIETIPLKNRREDIPLLLEHFFRNLFRDSSFHAEDILSKSLYQFLMNYDYPGNVQELMNLAQSLFSQYAAHPLIMVQLPPYIRKRLPQTEVLQSSLKKAVLTIIRNSPRSGRASIQKALADSGTEISDGKLRGLLTELASEELIFIHRTRGGCEITENGLTVLGAML